MCTALAASVANLHIDRVQDPAPFEAVAMCYDKAFLMALLERDKP